MSAFQSDVQPISVDVYPTEYHPMSELKDKQGYYPNLSAVQEEAIVQIKRLLLADDNMKYLTFQTAASAATITTPTVTRDNGDEVKLLLLRFSRARNFNVKLSYDMIVKDVEWRNEDNRNNLRKQTAEEILNCDLNTISIYFPTWIQGYDKQNRPVSYRQFGKFEIWNILKIINMETLIKFHAWESEQLVRFMVEKSYECRYNIETCCIVIDAKDWHVGLATSDAFTFIKGMCKTDSDHYPERLGRLIIINAPVMLSWAWKIISTFLDEVTRNKVSILSNRKVWEAKLQEMIDIDQIPIMYGGTAPDIVGADTIRSMNPPK